MLATSNSLLELVMTNKFNVTNFHSWGVLLLLLLGFLLGFVCFGFVYLFAASACACRDALSGSFLGDPKLSGVVVKGCCKWPAAPKLSPGFPQFHRPPTQLSQLLLFLIALILPTEISDWKFLMFVISWVSLAVSVCFSFYFSLYYPIS